MITRNIACIKQDCKLRNVANLRAAAALLLLCPPLGCLTSICRVHLAKVENREA